MIPKSVGSFREEYRSRISKYYSGMLHFCFTSFVSIGVFTYVVSRINNVVWAE